MLRESWQVGTTSRARVKWKPSKPRLCNFPLTADLAEPACRWGGSEQRQIALLLLMSLSSSQKWAADCNSWTQSAAFLILNNTAPTKKQKKKFHCPCLHIGKCPPPFFLDRQCIKHRLFQKCTGLLLFLPWLDPAGGERTERWLLIELLVSPLLGDLSSLRDSVDCVSLFPWTLEGSQGLFSPHEGSTHKWKNILGPRYLDGALPHDLPSFLAPFSLLILYMDLT